MNFWDKIKNNQYDKNVLQFQNDLYEEFGVSEHPKRGMVYSLAYTYGHSSGYHEVANYFSELVELIK